jgi:hypothetical protein
LEIDALPRPGRVYHRETSTESPDAASQEMESTGSIPELFLDRLKRDSDRAESSSVEDELDLTPVPVKERGLLDRMTLWMVE